MIISLGICTLSASDLFASVDIRVEGVLVDDLYQIPYIVSVSDCSELLSVSYSAGESTGTLSASDEISSDGDLNRCEFRFTGKGAGAYDPVVKLKFKDGSTVTHSKHFQQDSNKPVVSFNSVAISSIDGSQYLVVSANATDDTDITYVAFSVVGLKASVLRSVGGIIEQALNDAFAKTDGFKRVYPLSENQSEFTFAIKTNDQLSESEIAHDGIVIIDITAIDSSGNQYSTSKIAFTGEDVVEQASGLSVSPSQITFTSLLETATIIPTVDFQFRGPTPLPGYGTGVEYTSSHPNLIAVTQDGVVYPLAETRTENVTITVSYSDLAVVQIPVRVDLTKKLVSLKVEGLDAQGHLVLDRLNNRIALPKIVGVFDDGSESDISTQFPLEYILDENAAGIIDLDLEYGLKAKMIISDTAPMNMIVRLANQPDIMVTCPIVAKDALPSIDFDPSKTVTPGSVLKLSAEASDDVGISEVRFLMNGGLIGKIDKIPYELSVDIPSNMTNEILTFQAIAVDSAGQMTPSAEKTVTVGSGTTGALPSVSLYQPSELQRFVEGSPIRMSVQYVAGDPNSEDSQIPSGISYVEFYLDGKLIGTSHYPFRETRTVMTTSTIYEVWRYDSVIGNISTSETSMAIQAVAVTGQGEKVTTDARLIKVISNHPPTVTILSPITGSSVSVGQTLPVKYKVVDDTLSLGLTVNLLVNGKKYKSKSYSEMYQAQLTGNSNVFDDATSPKSKTDEFTIPIDTEMLGTNLRIQLEAVDFEGKIANTPVLNISVRNDQPPQVSIVNPVEGAHVVSGMSLEIRADAVDDIDIARVDFYVDDRLIGSDAQKPYTFMYKTPQGIINEQPLKLFAIAVDSSGQQAQSAVVKITLGGDKQAPVVNFVSPLVTLTEGSDELAGVIENSDVVVKVAGYDNVRVDRLVIIK